MAPQVLAAPSSSTMRKDFAAFRLTPDLRFLFPQAAHEAAVAALLGALRKNAGVLLATGDIGIGKTMLARRVEQELRRSGTIVAYVAYPDLGIGDLLRSLHGELELAPRPAGAAIDAAEAASMLAQAPAARRVLLVDDADACSNALLSNLDALTRETAGTRHALQVILFGTSALMDRIAAEIPQVSMDAASLARLSPLSPDETATYIRHRLAMHGAPQDVFSADAVEAIASYARGVPRLVNQACGRALLLAGPNRSGAISQAIIREAINDCPALALADPAIAAWATLAPREAAVALEPFAIAAAAIPDPDPAPLTPGNLTAADTMDAAEMRIAEAQSQLEPPDPAQRLIEPAAPSEPLLHLPIPPSAKTGESEPGSSQSGRRRKIRARPTSDSLRWSGPAPHDAAAPAGQAPRFAGFVPRSHQSRKTRPVESAGSIDAALRRPVAADGRRRLLPLAALGAVLAIAVGVYALATAEVDGALAVRDMVARAAAATPQTVRDAVNAIIEMVSRPAGAI